jgi:uncharacterized protein YbaR (Trm112 family)
MMNFLKKLFGKKQQSAIFSDEELTEAAACPNCWGHQDYDQEYLSYVKDQTKSNINKDKENKKAFVSQFVETNITGIRLKREGDHQVCPTCKTNFKHVSSKAN